MPAGILVVGADGRILAANPEANRLLGYGRNGLLGSDIALCVPVLGSVRGGLPGVQFRSTLESTVWRRDGTTRRVQLCCAALGGGPDASLGVWFTESRVWEAAEPRSATEETEEARWGEARELCWAARLIADGMLGQARPEQADDSIALSEILEALQRAIGPAPRRRFEVIAGGQRREPAGRAAR